MNDYPLEPFPSATNRREVEELADRTVERYCDLVFVNGANAEVIAAIDDPALAYEIVWELDETIADDYDLIHLTDDQRDRWADILKSKLPDVRRILAADLTEGDTP